MPRAGGDAPYVRVLSKTRRQLVVGGGSGYRGVYYKSALTCALIEDHVGNKSACSFVEFLERSLQSSSDYSTINLSSAHGRCSVS